MRWIFRADYAGKYVGVDENSNLFTASDRSLDVKFKFWIS